MSFENIAIKVENLSKCYHIYDNPSDRLKQFVAPRLQHMTWQSPKQYFSEFWALEDSLDLSVDLLGKEPGKDKPIYNRAKAQGG